MLNLNLFIVNSQFIDGQLEFIDGQLCIYLWSTLNLLMLNLNLVMVNFEFIVTQLEFHFVSICGQKSKGDVASKTECQKKSITFRVC